jgi:hypothetical protein
LAKMIEIKKIMSENFRIFQKYKIKRKQIINVIS